MRSLIFLDTETTGLNLSRLVELAYCIDDGEPQVLRVKPAVPITIGAMAIHHITEEDVAPLEEFKDMAVYAEIKKTIEEGIVVAHNALFDIEVLHREGIYVQEYIDTKEVAKAIFPVGPESYSLQYLRYYLKLPIDRDRLAHSAGGDTEVMRTLWDHLVANFEESLVAKFKRVRSLPKSLEPVHS